MAGRILWFDDECECRGWISDYETMSLEVGWQCGSMLALEHFESRCDGYSA